MLPCASVSKRVSGRNHSYENDFDLRENETACRTHFHMKGFALRLVLKQRHKSTRKWPVRLYIFTADILSPLQTPLSCCLDRAGRLGRGNNGSAWGMSALYPQKTITCFPLHRSYSASILLCLRVFCPLLSVF